MSSESEHPRWDAIREAAIEAEKQTGYREETDEEAIEALHTRILKAVAGFVVIAIGIVALPLPGPGWLIIIFGLTLLPFAWAERTVVLIRRRIPGVPEDGHIPFRTWIIMGVLVVGASVGGIVFQDQIGDAVASAKDWVL